MVEVFARIFQRFNDERGSITEQFSSNNAFSRATERQVTAALLLQVIRPAVREVVEYCINQLVKDLTSTHSHRPGMNAPEILLEAISRQDLTDYTTNLLVQRQDENATNTSLLYTVNTIGMAISDICNNIPVALVASNVSWLQLETWPNSSDKHPRPAAWTTINHVH